MESISVIEAVRRATDPFGMGGMRTAAMRPSAVEVIERLAELGFVVAPRAQVCTSDNPHDHQGDTCPIHEYHEYAVRLPDTTSWPTYESISESEQRVLDGNR
jgi:hypothetical protein